MSQTVISRTAGSYQSLCTSFEWRIPEYYNIGVDICDRHAATKSDHVAIFFEDESGLQRRYTFGQVRELSNKFANVLVAHDLRVGDRIAILLPQLPETAIAHVAVYKLGAIAVPMSPLFGPDAIQHRLRDSGARAIVTDISGHEKVADILDTLPDLDNVYIVGALADAGGHSFESELSRASSKFTPIRTRADDPALIIYTSGTTGLPKGVIHAHRVLLGHLPGYELSHNFFPQVGDLFWTPADWAWAGGLLDALLPTWHYAFPILGFKFSKKFDPELAYRLIQKYGVRNVFLPPTSLKLMRQVPRRNRIDCGSLRTIMSGGEPLGAEILAWAHNEMGVTINEIFGQTEANYVIGNCHELMPVKAGSMGRPYPGHDVTVVDEQGNLLPEGTTGELAVKRGTPVMFLEYLGKPEATQGKFSGDWMLTGDLASRDRDGYLFFKGRKDDVINSAGYRIGPTEIEECLLKHPAVALAAVIGVPDPTRGNVIKAFVQLASGFSPSVDLKRDIQTHVKSRLAVYEYPRLVEFVQEIPTTVTGKIKREELRRLEKLTM